MEPPRHDRRRGAVAALASLAVGLQISYPLLHGVARMDMTVAIVCVFGVTCLAHAAATRGVRRAFAVLAATAGIGFCVEVLGVTTGFPFGHYAYAPGLGPQVYGVPVVVGLAWTMLGWPAAIAARRLVRTRVARVLVGAWALTSADLFLDPQLVAGGAWRWQDPSPHLPGVETVPLSNEIGWLLVALVVSAALQAIAGDGRDSGSGDGVVVALYLWLWAGWSVALSVFLGLPVAAAWGAVGMGLVAVPLAIDTERRIRSVPRRAPGENVAPTPADLQRRSRPRASRPRTPEPATQHR